jgi:hypothetical protein
MLTPKERRLWTNATYLQVFIAGVGALIGTTIALPFVPLLLLIGWVMDCTCAHGVTKTVFYALLNVPSATFFWVLYTIGVPSEEKVVLSDAYGS